MKVLVAEDDRVSRLVLTTKLKKMGHEVLAAEDGTAAWEAFVSDHPQLVITDWMMPQTSGLQLCQMIRSQQSENYTYIIMLTALAGKTNYFEGMAAGADDFLTKPVDMEELTAHLRVAERILKLQAEAIERNAELEHTLRDLRAMQDALVQSEKLASLGQLTAGIAHEINNPLGYITSNLNRFEEYFDDLHSLYSQWAEFGPGRCENPSCLQKAEKLLEAAKHVDVDFITSDFSKLMQHTKTGAERIKTIVAQLRGFANISDSSFVEANINEAIEDTVTITWNEIKYKVTLQKEFGTIPPVTCNIGEIKQVLVNLLINATHAIPESGVITVRTFMAGELVAIQVADTGTGIPSENIKRIFDPFFTTKPVGKGTGLGLWICASLVHKHNGQIEVMSEIGKGTTFTVSLPIRQSQPPPQS